jgi:hypothetical protein
MTDEIIEIFSEDIDSEQWQRLLRFSYAENIGRYLASRNPDPANLDLVEYIAGCVTQAYEYFSAAKTVTLNTAPLLYYYGVINLLSAVCALLEGSRPDIQGHGLELDTGGTSSRIADLAITLWWREHGAFRKFCSTLDQSVTMEGGQPWSLMEILGSIPELKADFEQCYPDAQPHVIPVETVRLEELHLVRIALEDVDRFEDKGEMLGRVANLEGAYLPAMPTQTHLVLRPRLRAENLGVYSISGQKFLPLAHIKGTHSITLPTILYCFLGLYGLGFLSRYAPEIWTPFVRGDRSGERDMVLRFIRTSARIVPNLALNELYQKRLCFVNRPQGSVDLSERITSKKIREIMRSEIKQL